MAKQLLTPLRPIARMNFSLKNYSCELLNSTDRVGKVELKPGLHISRKDRKHRLEKMFFKLYSYGLVFMW